MNLRAVRSFVRREGRMTPAQAAALTALWPAYGLDYAPCPADLPVLFGRDAERVLEIGFGNGDALLAQAEAEPQRDFLGIEVHRPGAGSLLRRADAQGVRNLRVSTHDAVEVLRDQLPPASFAAVHLFFPDPWPKKRHHKRRIVQPPFVALVAAVLVDGGRFHLATDWAPYADWMRQAVSADPAFGPAYASRADGRPQTRFERRGVRLGHSVEDLIYTRRAR